MIGPFDGWLGALTFATALGCGLVGGVFFAFSTFVMPALARLPAAQGIAAMQSINVAVITPSVMVPLFGTGAACLLLAVASLLTPSRPGRWLVLAGAVLYVAGTVLVTIVGNVPLNDSLAAVDAAGAEGARVWAFYLTAWTAWNHVRTIAALAAAAALTLALLSGRSH
ncbi:MAG TPA: anthrone oxygenase family protein [Dehalococcoidia bacterium]